MRVGKVNPLHVLDWQVELPWPGRLTASLPAAIEEVQRQVRSGFSFDDPPSQVVVLGEGECVPLGWARATDRHLRHGGAVTGLRTVAEVAEKASQRPIMLSSAHTVSSTRFADVGLEGDARAAAAVLLGVPQTAPARAPRWDYSFFEAGAEAEEPGLDVLLQVKEQRGAPREIVCVSDAERFARLDARATLQQMPQSHFLHLGRRVGWLGPLLGVLGLCDALEQEQQTLVFASGAKGAAALLIEAM